MKLYLTIVAAILTCAAIFEVSFAYKAIDEHGRRLREQRRIIANSQQLNEVMDLETHIEDLAEKKQGGHEVWIEYLNYLPDPRTFNGSLEQYQALDHNQPSKRKAKLRRSSRGRTS